MRTYLTSALLLVISLTTLSAQTAEQILEKYFAAIGGRENLKNFTASAGEAMTIQHYPKRDTAISYTISKAPYSFSYKTFKKNELQFETYGNDKGTTHFLYKPYPMKIERDKQKINISIAHEVLNAFVNRRIKRLEDTTINAAAAFVVKTNVAKKGSPLNRTYYFDQKSFMLIGASSDALAGDLTIFERYKPTGNLLVPTKMRYQLNGALINEIEVQRLEINPTLSDSLFIPKESAPPTKAKFRLNNKIDFLDAKLGNLTFAELIKTFNGTPVLIDLWASWCGPCKYEFAKYDDAYFHFLKSKNIQTVFISVDKPEKEGEWKEVVNQFTLNGYHLRAGKRLEHSIQKQFYQGNGMYIPRMILVDKDGQILSDELPKLSSGIFYTKVEELIE